MAFPSNKVPEVLDEIIALVSDTKSRAERARSLASSGDVDANQVLNLMQSFARTQQKLATLRNVGGLNSYAQVAFANPALNIVNEVNSVRTEMRSVVNWIDNTFPKEASFWPRELLMEFVSLAIYRRLLLLPSLPAWITF